MASNARPGTFAPGTKVQVGKHRVVIEKYLSEGGFAHVYVVRIPRSSGKFDIAVLKRVAVPDKEALANMRTEVETMKRLKGHKHIVTYIDSHASQLKGGGYEVFLLMEFCAGGGLIDFMNTRLQHRLTEPEILKIFSDVAEGVACMHYLKPPLLHRDLKVENVLISTSGTSKFYKICDFGSAANARPAAKSATEGRLIEDDIQRHTTLQYRSPEMIDVYRGQPIDEKSDVWALGVLLYKLCYYTTPFEDQGQIAILNATFRYPPIPSFSTRLKQLIAWLLQENVHSRPNIYQVIKEVCLIRGTRIPLENIYFQSPAATNQELNVVSSLKAPTSASLAVGLQRTSAISYTQEIPEIKPMRRGRPPAQVSSAHNPTKSSKRAKNDPFAALDSTSDPVRAAAVDELASRFPSLDEFSILHDKGSKFDFSQTDEPGINQTQFNEKVSEALVDEAFRRPHTSTSEETSSIFQNNRTQIASKATEKPKTQLPRETQIPNISLKQRQMVSTGTMTSQSPLLPISQTPSSNHTRPSFVSSSVLEKKIDRPRFGKPSGLLKQDSEPDIPKKQRPPLLNSYRSKSFITADLMPRSPVSSRPSLESKRPTELGVEDPISRSRSFNSKIRPSSMHLQPSPKYYQERKHTNGVNSFTNPYSDSVKGVRTHVASESVHGHGEGNISSDIDFLRVIEDEEPVKKRTKAVENKSTKRSSLPASISNTKNILAGKFGDAFRKFENNNVGNRQHTLNKQADGKEEVLASITGSVNTDVHTEDIVGMDETEDLMPEVRREFERMQMQQEEKRVAEAAVAYRQNLGDQEVNQKFSKTNKASTIQDHVKTLLQDNDTSTSGNSNRQASPPLPLDPSFPSPVKDSKMCEIPSNHITDISQAEPRPTGYKSIAKPLTRASVPPVSRALPRPTAPPKPEALRSGSQVSLLASSRKKSAVFQAGPPAKSHALKGRFEATEDLEANFNKRYPNLSRLDMVEM